MIATRPAHLAPGGAVSCAQLFSSSALHALADITWGEFEDGFPNILINHVEKLHGRDVIFIADFLNLKEIFAQLSGTEFSSPSPISYERGLTRTVLYQLPKYLINSLTVRIIALGRRTVLTTFIGSFIHVIHLRHAIQIILPYFPTGTMERVDYEGQVHALLVDRCTVRVNEFRCATRRLQVATAYTLAKLLSGTPLTISGPSKLIVSHHSSSPLRSLHLTLLLLFSLCLPIL